MVIEKIVGIALVSVILSVLLKGYNPSVAISVSLIAVVVMFAIISPYLKIVLSSFVNISSQIGMEIKYIVTVIKVIGIAYITQIGAEICRDSGENAVATKVEICGKIVIMVMSLPIVYELFSVISDIVNLV
ncbi:MAG: stage III sporulation protein AD [Ruminococcaceae bacterium]|nr:stage III sporulation protein AD [Oscillospiraceae bacterium]